MLSGHRDQQPKSWIEKEIVILGFRGLSFTLIVIALAGVQFAFNSDDAKFGLNGGGGVNFRLTQTTAAFAEVKYVFGDWDGFTVTLGIYF